VAASPDSGRTLFGFMPLFGLDPVAHEGDRITGPLSGIWFVIFVLPMFLLTPDYPAKRPVRDAIRDELANLRRTLAELTSRKSMATFLLANMIYTDGLVSLFAFGGIYAAGTFGWNTTQVGSFGVIVAVAAALGAWFGGKLDDKFGPKRVMIGSLLVLLASSIVILLVDRQTIALSGVASPAADSVPFSSAAERAYLVLGCMIGAAGGPLQAASRTLLIRMAPKDSITQYFGLFTLSGKITSFSGPLLIGVVTERAGMAVLTLFFLSGLVLLAQVQEE
jgi:UMF1 family MFS transporter